MTSTDFLTGVSIWTGAVVGTLKVIDWLLSERQKKWLSERLVDAWVWLESQRLGRFIELLRSPRIQRVFVILTHIEIAYIASGFLLRVYLGWDTHSEVQIGHPRVYLFQTWVDVAAVMISAIVLSWRIHPRIAMWIASAKTIPRYFGRAGAVLVICFALMGCIIFAETPIMGFSSPAFNDRLTEAQVVQAYEDMLGGKVGVVVTHALTALISAPILAEALFAVAVLFLSFYWIVIVYLLMLVTKILSFSLERISAAKDGPVLALSGILVGAGALAKAVLGK
jgi:hypothetical protein